MCVHVCVEAHMNGGQRATCSSQFSPSPTWVPGVELRASVLAASTFAHWATSIFFKKKKQNPILSIHHKSKDNPTEKFKHKDITYFCNANMFWAHFNLSESHWPQLTVFNTHGLFTEQQSPLETPGETKCQENWLPAPYSTAAEGQPWFQMHLLL